LGYDLASAAGAESRRWRTGRTRAEQEHRLPPTPADRLLGLFLMLLSRFAKRLEKKCLPSVQLCPSDQREPSFASAAPIDKPVFLTNDPSPLQFWLFHLIVSNEIVRGLLAGDVSTGL
jgi:hypothetical protein